MDGCVLCSVASKFLSSRVKSRWLAGKSPNAASWRKGDPDTDGPATSSPTGENELVHFEFGIFRGIARLCPREPVCSTAAGASASEVPASIGQALWSFSY